MTEEIHLESPLPLYRQMADVLRREIEAQALAPGTRLPTEKDLARRFQVSLITVRACVTELVREGILLRRQGRGTFIASRKARATQLITAIVPDLTDYFSAEIVTGIQSAALPFGYELVAASSHDHAQTERMLLDRAVSRGVEGLIIVTGRGSFANGALVGNRLFMPLILIDSYHPNVEADCFHTNDVIGAYDATRHLIESGYQRIGHLAGPKGHFLAELRVNGWRRALREAGITVENGWLGEAGATAADGHRGLMALVRQAPALDAVFAYNDLVAIGALRALAELGRRVPEQFGVAGYGNHALAAFVHPPLTTIDTAPRQVGIKAAQRLLARIREEVPAGDHHKDVLPVRLITGDSGGHGKG